MTYRDLITQTTDSPMELLYLQAYAAYLGLRLKPSAPLSEARAVLGAWLNEHGDESIGDTENRFMEWMK